MVDISKRTLVRCDSLGNIVLYLSHMLTVRWMFYLSKKKKITFPLEKSKKYNIAPQTCCDNNPSNNMITLFTLRSFYSTEIQRALSIASILWPRERICRGFWNFKSKYVEQNRVGPYFRPANVSMPLFITDGGKLNLKKKVPPITVKTRYRRSNRRRVKTHWKTIEAR